MYKAISPKHINTIPIRKVLLTTTTDKGEKYSDLNKKRVGNIINSSIPQNNVIIIPRNPAIFRGNKEYEVILFIAKMNNFL